MSEEKKIDEIAKSIGDTLQHVSSCYESNRKIIENHDELIRGLAALLENHTSALRAHQVILESLAAKAGIVLAAVNQNPDTGPVN